MVPGVLAPDLPGGYRAPCPQGDSETGWARGGLLLGPPASARWSRRAVGGGSVCFQSVLSPRSGGPCTASGGTARSERAARRALPLPWAPLPGFRKCSLCSEDVLLSRKAHLSNDLPCLWIPDAHGRHAELVGGLLQGFREAPALQFPWALGTESASGSQHTPKARGLRAQVGVAEWEGEEGPLWD